MTPKRGDCAVPPPRAGEYDIRFADHQAAAGWKQLCAQAVGSTRRGWEMIAADPRPSPQVNATISSSTLLPLAPTVVGF